MNVRTAEGDAMNIPGCPPSIHNEEVRKVWGTYAAEICKLKPMTPEDIRSHEKLFMEYDRIMTELGRLQHRKRNAKFIMDYQRLYKQAEKLIEEIAHRMNPLEFPGNEDQTAS